MDSNVTDVAAGSSAGIEAIRYILQTHVMFSGLAATERRRVESAIELRTYEPGQTITRQGEPIDGMYILYSGRARLKAHQDAKTASLGVITSGETLGEMSLIQETLWPTTTVAEERVTVLRLPRAAAQQLMTDSRVIDNQFRQFVALVQVGARLRALLHPAQYEQSDFIELLKQFGVKYIQKGNSIFKQGDPDPRLYYIESGLVELIRTPLNEEPITLSRVGRGALIGEGAALPLQAENALQPHTALAATDVTVYVIKKEVVDRIIEIQPGLAERLRHRSRELEALEQTELAMRNRAEGVDQRIRLADAITEDEFKRLSTKAAPSKVSLIRQNKQNEAAAACLTMVANHYGKGFTLGQMKEVTGLDTETATPDQIIRGAETLGMRAAAQAITYEELKTAKLPGIIGWESYHWAMVYQVTDKEVFLADPKSGLKRLKKEDFVKSWTAARVAGVEDTRADAGVFIALNPTTAFEQQKAPKSSIGYFLNFILPYKGYYAEAILAAVVINVLGLAAPLFVQTIVDTVVVQNDAGLLNTMLGGMALVAILTALMTVAQSLLLAHTTARIDMRMMAEFYRHILHLPMDFFMKRNKGELLARFGENQKVRGILTGSTIMVMMNTLMIFVYIFMMAAYNLTLTTVVLVFIPLYIVIVAYFTPRIKRIAQEIFLANSQSQSYLIESLNGIEALKASNNEYFARMRWENAFVDNVNRGFRQQRLQLLSDSFFKLATLSSTIVILWLGATEVMAGNMSIGELMGFNMLMGLVIAPVLQMVNLWNNFQEVRIAMDRVGDVISVDVEQPPAASPELMPTTLGRIEGRITFEKVNFSYTTNDQTKSIMREFDLDIAPGEHVALVGPSGCGKSTIAKMVLGFYRPSSGRVLIDGKDIATVDLGNLRRNIGVVLQDGFIFSGTVAENIALGDPEPDMQAVQEVARLAGAEEFIINYPQSYQTPIGEKGMGISGGQRQRICIARALYRRPRIMIFDEATSALDNQSEERIIAQLEIILKNRTSITIAHRLTTIIDSDRICYIRDGKVQEQGTHEQLIDPDYLRAQGYGGLYYDLAKSQFDLPPLELPVAAE